MSTPRILITAGSLAGRADAMIREAGFEPVYSDANATEAELAEHARKTEAEGPVVAIISRAIPLGAPIMEALPALAVITKHGAGVDNIRTAEADARGIGVLRATGVNSRAVAEMALALILAATRNLLRHANATAAGEWDRARWKGEELEGKTLGILGFGFIGAKLARLAAPLFRGVIVHDPVVDADRLAEAGAQAVSLDELVRRADVLSLHCPLNDATRRLVNADLLARMPKGAILVNTARGELVDEAALLAALDGGHLRAAALDAHILERPNDDEMLRRHPQVIATPHIGGSTRQALEKLAEISVENTLRYLRGEEIAPEAVVTMPAVRKGAPA